MSTENMVKWQVKQGFWAYFAWLAWTFMTNMKTFNLFHVFFPQLKIWPLLKSVCFHQICVFYKIILRKQVNCSKNGAHKEQDTDICNERIKIKQELANPFSYWNIGNTPKVWILLLAI